MKAVRHGKSGAPPRCRLIKIRRTLNFSLRSIAYIDFVRNGFAKFAYKNTLRKKIPQGNFAMYGYFKDPGKMQLETMWRIFQLWEFSDEQKAILMK